MAKLGGDYMNDDVITYSKSEMARKLGLSKDTVAGFISRHDGITPVERIAGTDYYSEQVYKTIKKHYETKKQVTLDDVMKELKSMEEALKILDTNDRFLNGRINKLVANLSKKKSE